MHTYECITWYDIPAYVGLYEISEYGAIWSTRRNKQLRTYMNRPDGYKTVCLSVGGKCKWFCIHRLVLCSSEGIKYNAKRLHGKQCNHKDGDKLNTHVSNLEWVTARENALHSRRVLGKCCGEKSNSNKLKNADVLEILAKLRAGIVSAGTIAKEYNISDAAVSSIKHGRTWQSVTGILHNKKRVPRHKKITNLSGKRTTKLTLEQVVAIKLELARGLSCTVLGRKYNVSRQTIGAIKRGATWRHV